MPVWQCIRTLLAAMYASMAVRGSAYALSGPEGLLHVRSNRDARIFRQASGIYMLAQLCENIPGRSSHHGPWWTGHETEFVPSSVELAGTCTRQRQKERQASSHPGEPRGRACR